MAQVISSSVRLNPAQLNRMLHGRDGQVGRIMAGFAGLSTVQCKRVAGERIIHRTHEYVNSISSRTVGRPSGVAVETSARAAHAATLERGSPSHMIFPRRTTVLRFDAQSGEVVYAPYVVHPGTRPYNILRDGVRRAGRQLSLISRL